ncbi:MAG: ParB/Srx family N-terminal domain-containing protein [Roseiarcus sp.]|uniref:ParB/Srx family N-terminal domain-containing protein n=1 Tax=Roseiarcus sp. TaxID=1969460 RepID=UPI003C35197F
MGRGGRRCRSPHRGRARSKAGEAEDLRDADAERRAARVSVRWLPVESLTPDPENARVHGSRQIARIADSIAAFGFNVPIVIDGNGAVLAGHGRVLAARRLGLSEVPTIALEHLSEAERRAFMIADNRLAELASWDDRRLGVELKALKSLDLDFSIEATGFELDEIELKIDPRIKSGGSRAPGKRPAAASPKASPVAQPGDEWTLGPHRLRCGNDVRSTTLPAIDAAIRRWQAITGNRARLRSTGEHFDKVARVRRKPVPRPESGSAEGAVARPERMTSRAPVA